MWDVVLAASVTPNTYNIVQCTGVPTLALVLRVKGQVNVKALGALGDGVTDDIAVMHYACANYDDVLFPLVDTNYIHSTTFIPLDRNDQKITFEEGAELKHTGTGVGVQLGRTDNSARYNCKVINIRAIGNANTTDNIVCRALSHSYLETPNARDCTGSSLRILWCIELLVNAFNTSLNEGAFNVQPTYGLRISEIAVGQFSVGCTFLNPTIEGTSSDGIFIENGSDNNFIGGTTEGNGSGATIAAGCRRNKFISVWMEANNLFDVFDAGVANEFDNCYLSTNAPSQPNVQANGQGLQLKGGFCRVIQLEVAGKDTRLDNVGFSDNASLGIKGTGSRQVRGCYEVDTNGDITGVLPDEISIAGTFSPLLEGASVAGSNTYNTNAGVYRRIGDVVTFSLDIHVANKDAGMTGNAIVTGLPFQAQALGMTQALAVSQHSLITYPGVQTTLIAEVTDASTSISLICVASAGVVAGAFLNSTGIVNGSRLKISGSYIIQ